MHMQAEMVNISGFLTHHCMAVCYASAVGLYRSGGLLCARGRTITLHSYITYFLIVSVLALEGKAWYTLVQSEEHTSELQSPDHLVCRLLLEKKKPAGRMTELLPAVWSCTR